MISTSRQIVRRIVICSILTHYTLFLENYEHILIPSLWNWTAFRWRWILPSWCREEYVSHRMFLAEHSLRRRWCWLSLSCLRAYSLPGEHKNWEQLQAGCYVLTYPLICVFLIISIECCQRDGGSCFPLLLLFHNQVFCCQQQQDFCWIH